MGKPFATYCEPIHIWMTEADVARALGITVAAVGKLRRSGALRHRPGSPKMIPAVAVAVYVAAMVGRAARVIDQTTEAASAERERVLRDRGHVGATRPDGQAAPKTTAQQAMDRAESVAARLRASAAAIDNGVI